MLVLAMSAHPNPRPFCAGMLVEDTRGSKEAVTVVGLPDVRATPIPRKGLRERHSLASLGDEAE